MSWHTQTTNKDIVCEKTLHTGENTHYEVKLTTIFGVGGVDDNEGHHTIELSITRCTIRKDRRGTENLIHAEKGSVNQDVLWNFRRYFDAINEKNVARHFRTCLESFGWWFKNIQDKGESR